MWRRMKMSGLLMIFMAAAPGINERFNVLEAIEKGLIHLESVGISGELGSAIEMRIRPKSSGKVHIVIPAGTHFISQDETEQDIFVVTDHDAIIAGHTVVNVEGFCSQLANRSPGEGSLFQIAKTSNNNLQKLAAYMNGKVFDADTKQAAVWAVSDGQPIADIYGDAEENEVHELRDFISNLTGAENQWYNTRQEIRIDEDRNIVLVPTKVAGEISYHVKKPGQMQTTVCDGAGNELFRPSSTMHLPRTGDYSFWFKFEVKGWLPGLYQVRVLIDEEPIHVQEFRV